MASVEVLMRMHKAFRSSLEDQREELNAMERAAEQLLQTGQSGTDEVRASCDAVMLR